ncbi:hypothetical protein BMF77_pb00031 (plasmid) [Dolichospermum sp. UHCC 0315A]|nr:hypothetical protein BMF77_04914 [Dolichospermum sp. UHCC 0315A]QEI44429.1 hypothetical protein BMF77_pb00031 [Dolichospermum sp. UHCC 0315A]
MPKAGPRGVARPSALALISTLPVVAVIFELPFIWVVAVVFAMDTKAEPPNGNSDVRNVLAIASVPGKTDVPKTRITPKVVSFSVNSSPSSRVMVSPEILATL